MNRVHLDRETEDRVVDAARRDYDRWKARLGLTPVRRDRLWRPCLRELATGRRCWLQPGPRLDAAEGCTCRWGAFGPGAKSEMLLFRGEPVAIFGHRTRVDDGFLTDWEGRVKWIARWPELELVVSAGSWVDVGAVVVAFYNRAVWRQVGEASSCAPTEPSGDSRDRGGV